MVIVPNPCCCRFFCDLFQKHPEMEASMSGVIGHGFFYEDNPDSVITREGMSGIDLIIVNCFEIGQFTFLTDKLCGDNFGSRFTYPHHRGKKIILRTGCVRGSSQISNSLLQPRIKEFFPIIEEIK